MEVIHEHNDCNDDGLNLDDVSLENINKDNLTTVMKLEVSGEQSRFVAPNSVSIAQGHYTDTAVFKAICYENIPVGFVMIDNNVEKNDYYLWRIMIDERYQGNGIGSKALELILEFVKNQENSKELYTSTLSGDDGPSYFFEKNRFVRTNRHEEDEIVYVYKF